MKLFQILIENSRSEAHNYDMLSIRRMLSKRFASKAKIYHIDYEYGPEHDACGWTLLIVNNQKLDAVMRSLGDVKDKNYDFYYQIVPNPSLNKNYLSQLEMLFERYNIQDVPGVSKILIFYNFKIVQKASLQNKEYYHVTDNDNVIHSGISPQPSLKYKHRIYIWDDINGAIKYAQFGRMRGKSITDDTMIYILRINGIQNQYIHQDPEIDGFFNNEHAFYTSEPITADKISLYDKNTRKMAAVVVT